MLAAASRFLPATATFFRQIVPPVIATLIAAVLITAYNNTFSGHLKQPRMSALHVEASAEPAAPITTVGMTKPPAPPAAAVTETVTIYEDAIEPERLWEKDAKEEAGKDQTIRLAAEPAPAPVRTASPAPKSEPRTEAHRVATLELGQPVVRAPVPVIIAVPPSVVAPPATAPVVAAMPMQEQRQPQYQPPPYQQPQYQPPYQPQQYQQPAYQQPQYQQPPVVMGTPPMVTVPDRPNARPPQGPVEEAQAEPPRPQGPIGTFVNVFKPSNWFARAREFGEKIEAAGNDILPNIRQ